MRIQTNKLNWEVFFAMLCKAFWERGTNNKSWKFESQYDIQETLAHKTKNNNKQYKKPLTMINSKNC